ncbi:hypothetical protein GA0070609_2058 [Micromonospora echinaurantiaca]|uniref:DUF5666 domain-containing protein n=1 Tax=Micromonospora echinaurantiaca TaxID=47857 RepID=A0A1C5HQT7_9ACTN|nr:hypothetical protein [Micromonospora echinaurantiaca]SCG48359.1 hypothetical protein GA0070609_2058 [Micromonospora echinaurantiaca]
MRRAFLLLTAIGLGWSMTACSAGDASDPAATGQPPSAPPSAATPSPGGPTPPVERPPATAPPRPTPSPPAATPPPGGGEVPGPLPFGARTLTGTVERAGDCTMLLVGERRWALTGEVAAALRPGARVTVRGNVAPRPAACGDRDLAQTVAVTRADPA